MTHWMRFRKARWLLALAGVCASILARTTACAEEPLLAHAELVTPESTQAIDRGLQYLAERQLDDGSFGASGMSRNVAVCAFGGMAFLAAGSTPGRGEYGMRIDRCIDYLLANTSDAGVIGAADRGGRNLMYGQGFAALFLCEVHGMTERTDVRDRIASAVDLIVAAQNEQGGWRYQPAPQDADVSVTVCQVMALRAARNAGIAVPRETIDRSIDYVRKCQNADGGFRYMLDEGSADSGFARSAAGVVAFYNAGLYDAPEVTRGLDYLAKHRPGKQPGAADAYYFYGHYYAAQAMWHAGDEHWKAWYPAIRDQLVARQRSDGSWLDAICPEYGTAMACIVLQTPNNYLPILQR